LAYIFFLFSVEYVWTFCNSPNPGSAIIDQTILYKYTILLTFL